jgi:hypothetical protein
MLAAHPPFVVHEGHEPEREPTDEEQAVAREVAPVPIDDAVLDRLECAFDRLDQQEDEDSGGERGQARLERGARVSEPAQRQPEEDGGSGDASEQYDLCSRQLRSLPGL